MQRFRRSYTLVGALGPPAASISTDDVRACAERGRRVYELPDKSTLPRIVNRDTNMEKGGEGTIALFRNLDFLSGDHL